MAFEPFAHLLEFMLGFLAVEAALINSSITRSFQSLPVFRISAAWRPYLGAVVIHTIRSDPKCQLSSAVWQCSSNRQTTSFLPA